MAKQRLINCDFLNDSAFIDDTSNKAKLLYLCMLINADDMGFVGNTKNIVDSLQKNDMVFRQETNLELLNNDYIAAKNELVDRGYLYEFKNNHGGRVYLIRHWWYHNHYKKGLRTNYHNFLEKVEIVNSKYVLKKKSNTKENKLNQNKLNQNNINDNHSSDDKEWNDLFEEEKNDPKPKTEEPTDEIPF